ncbi:nucleotide pyrophosphohydrolase [Streptomyces sp. PT12]|uniref:nucleotide pyrophosphohydrolase n=1 Tax=Streptomyces sp. PT12 TaxID=1510197 RepID=UPI000DE3B02B|nr:nucleotide pyrophosphohydrolase [Streptomyces sp. PT12]RBM12342.1 nucleotide pyrophosphohydrolase [Streptomyces sp. PT12]
MTEVRNGTGGGPGEPGEPSGPGGPGEAFDAYAARLFAFVRERAWEAFETPKNLAMALGGECGELLAALQWLGDEEIAARMRRDPAFHEAVASELADVLNYLLRLARHLDVDLLAAAGRKLERNRARYPVELARGTAATYTELAAAAGNEPRPDGRPDGWPDGR